MALTQPIIKKAPAKDDQGEKKGKPAHNVSRASLDPNNPVPFEDGRWYTLDQGTQYLPLFAPDDSFARTCLQDRMLSTTHNACVVTKRNYCAGAGFYDKNGKEFSDAVKEWFQTMNLKNQNATKINRSIFESHFGQGNTPIEIVKLTVGGKKRMFIYAHDVQEWRLCRPDENDIVQQAVYSKRFRRGGIITAEEFKAAKVLPIYNPLNNDKDNWFKDDKGAYRTLIWYKNDVIGFPYYGIPSALASMIFQILEYKGARYNLDNFDNNMVVGGILALRGNLGQTEADRIGKKTINTHTGDGKRGRVIVVASEEGIDGSDFHQFDTTKDGSYITADDRWSQKIILANEWDAFLAGIVSPSTLGKGAGFLIKILEIKQSTVIGPAQDELISDVWSHIFKIADEWLGLGLSDLEIGIKSRIDISGLTDVDITPAVQVNEVRRAKGLPEDPAMDGVYMKSTGPQQSQPQQEGGGNV